MVSRLTGAQVRTLIRAFRASGTKARAEGEKRYLKSDMKFYGVPVPKIRSIARTFCKEHPDMTHAQLWALVDELWGRGYHELRSVAIAILERFKAALKAPDIRRVERLLASCNTWAHVDWLAISVAGNLISRYVSARKRLNVWARHKNMWLRRSSLLALRDELRDTGAAYQLFEQLSQPMLVEKEFFIRKAIGWMLREMVKHHPELTERYVRAHINELSTLAFREATRKLPAKTQRKLSALRR